MRFRGKDKSYNDSDVNHYLRNVCRPEVNNCIISNYDEYTIECCQLPLDEGAKINSKYDGDSPLSNACEGTNEISS